MSIGLVFAVRLGDQHAADQSLLHHGIAKMLCEQVKPTSHCSAEEYERDMEDRLRKGLY